MGSPKKDYLYSVVVGTLQGMRRACNWGGGYLYREPGEPGLAGSSEQLPGFCDLGRPWTTVGFEPPVRSVSGAMTLRPGYETHRQAYRYTGSMVLIDLWAEFTSWIMGKRLGDISSQYQNLLSAG